MYLPKVIKFNAKKCRSGRALAESPAIDLPGSTTEELVDAIAELHQMNKELNIPYAIQITARAASSRSKASSTKREFNRSCPVAKNAIADAAVRVPTPYPHAGGDGKAAHRCIL